MCIRDRTIVDTIKPSETPIVFINREPDKSVLDSYADKCLSLIHI